MPAAGNRTDQGYLNRLPADRLPKEVTQDIFAKVEEQSVMMSLGRQIPISLNENVLLTSDTFPEAGQVGGTTLASREGAEKPIQGIGFGTQRAFSPIKLAVIVTVSDEFARTNPDALYSQLSTELSGAVARAADLAVFHGRDALTGNALVGITNNSFVDATTNRVELDFASNANPDLVAQLLAGVELVEEDDEKNYEVTGFAAVKQLRPKLVQARDSQGAPVFSGAYPGNGSEIRLGSNRGELFGLPVSYGKSVRGKLGAYAGSDTRMFAGDWSQLAWGYADSIRVKVTDQATVGGVSMWQTNQIAVLAECTFGWIVNDPDAFVAYELAPESSS